MCEFIMYEQLRSKFKEIVEDNQLYNCSIDIISRVLSKEEAIGNPEHNDYPLLKGKESLMESDFCGSKGAAYSDMCGNFKGTLDDVVNLQLNNNYRRAVFISSVNAVLRYLCLISNTEHCRDDGLVECADHLKGFLEENYPDSKILLIGFQPRFAETLTRYFNTNIIDLDVNNIGKKINGVEVVSEEKTDELIHRCDLLFVTSSTFVNGTASKFILPEKKTIFYGVSGAGPTYLLGLNRYCYQ